MTNVFNYDEKLNIKIGNETPYSDVNVAYFKTPEINPENNVKIFNDLINSDFFIDNYTDKKYVTIPDQNHILHDLHNYQKEIFFMNNFLLTDYKDKQNNILYYAYKLRYKHSDYEHTNVEDSITIEDWQGKKITQEDLPHKIVSYRNGMSDQGLALYDIYIYLSNVPKDKSLFVSYNPNNLKIKNYKESINANSAFSRTSIENIFKHENDITYKKYGKQSINSGYNILVPIRADTINRDYYDYSFEYYPSVPYRYKIFKEGYEESQTEGVAFGFIVDKSGSMGGDKERATENAVNNFITQFTNPTDEIKAKFNIVYFNDEVSVSPGYHFAGENSGLRCSFNSNDGTDIDLGITKSLSIFQRNKSQNEGYKKVIILLTDGKDSTSNNTFTKRNTQAHNSGIDEIYAIGVGKKVDADGLKKFADSGKYKPASQASDLDSVYDEIAEECAPVLIKKLDDSKMKLTDQNKKEYIPVDTTPPPDLDESTITYEMVDPYNCIESSFVRRNADGTIEYLGDEISTSIKGNIYLEVYSTAVERLYSKKHYIKSDNDASEIYAKLDERLTRNDNWYLEVKNGSFNVEKSDYVLHYDIPEFNNQEFSDVHGSPYRHSEENVFVKNNKLRTREFPLYISGTKKVFKDNKEIQTPTNITVTDEDNNKLTILDWNKNTGELKLYENYEGVVTVDYTYKEKWHTYSGYYDDEGNNIHLDLNPTYSHFYVDNNPYTSGILQVKPSISLYSNPVYLYIIPKCKIPKKEDVKGFYNGSTLFHTIGEPLKNNHPFIKDDIKKGLYEFEDVKLICTVFIRPYLDIDRLNIEDTRTRGGGLREEEDKIELDLFNTKGVWDITNWDGEPYPTNGVIIIELPKDILNTFTKKQVLEKINKQIGYGVYPVIKYV